MVDGFYIVRVPGIVRVNFRDTYLHYIGPPTVLIRANNNFPDGSIPPKSRRDRTGITKSVSRTRTTWPSVSSGTLRLPRGASTERLIDILLKK